MYVRYDAGLRVDFYRVALSSGDIQKCDNPVHYYHLDQL